MSQLEPVPVNLKRGTCLVIDATSDSSLAPFIVVEDAFPRLSILVDAGLMRSAFAARHRSRNGTYAVVNSRCG